MTNKFIAATINNSTIYIKVDSTIIVLAVDILHDNKYVVKASTIEDWENNIDYGLSYEIDTIEEIETFNNNNKQFKYEK